jgi:hypothetical protein
MELPMELVNRIIMMQRAKYPWTHKDINKASLLRDLFKWAKQWNNTQFVFNVAMTIDCYIKSVEEDTSEMDEEDMEYHRDCVLENWLDFVECINEDAKPLEVIGYKPLDTKIMKSIKFYWHHRYH